MLTILQIHDPTFMKHGLRERPNETWIYEYDMQVTSQSLDWCFENETKQ